MVITHTMCGLGNQMFQYAMGRAVAHRLGTPLKLDISSFGPGYTKRRFELDRFQIKAELASPEEIRALTGLLGTRSGPKAESIRGICRRLGALGRFIIGAYVQEKHFHFDPTMLSVRGDVYLHGRWQSERYFSDIAAMLRDDFQMQRTENEDQEFTKRMTENELSVSLHVRRGDYVTLSQQGHVYTTLPMEYYDEAVAYMRRELGRPRFFIFSDEPLWVQDSFHMEDATGVSLSGSDKGPRELTLMTKCRHHIIANSTFSWWGAWLSSQKDGIVCAPQRWFAPEEQRRRCMDDLLPATWIRL